MPTMTESPQDACSLWPQRATRQVNLSRKRFVERAVVLLTEEEQEDLSCLATGRSAAA
jgi:hypothetical protein